MDSEPVQLAQMFNWTSNVPSLLDLPSLLEQGIRAEDCLVRSIYVQYRISSMVLFILRSISTTHSCLNRKSIFIALVVSYLYSMGIL